MRLCINPSCSNPQNEDSSFRCTSCQSDLLLDGSFIVKELLNASALSRVYRISEADEPKVLKVVSRDSDPKLAELFGREVDILLNHSISGIPKGECQFDYTSADNTSALTCLVMEYVPGIDLDRWLQARSCKPVREKLALQWLKSISQILGRIHDLNFYHRDIKPSNIMLGPDGSLVLIDFGIVGLIDSDYEQKKAQQKVTRYRTMEYAPNEQAEGEASIQSDFFALGRTFVELVTGKAPPEFCSRPYRNQNTDEDWSWREHSGDLSNEFCELLDWLMQPSVKLRPQNAESIVEHIENIETSLFQANENSGRIDSAVLREASLSFRCPLGSVFSWHPSTIIGLEYIEDSRCLVSASQDGTVSFWNTNDFKLIQTAQPVVGMISCIASSQDGIILGCDNGTVSVWGLKENKVLITNLKLHTKGVNDVSVNSDATSVVSCSDDGSVMMWNIKSNTYLNKLSHYSSPPRRLLLTADESKLFVGTASGDLKFHSRAEWDAHSKGLLCLVGSADQNSLVSAAEDGTVKVWSQDSLALLHELETDETPVHCLCISEKNNLLFGGDEVGNITAWNLVSGEKVFSHSAGSGNILGIAFDEEQNVLFSAGVEVISHCNSAVLLT